MNHGVRPWVESPRKLQPVRQASIRFFKLSSGAGVHLEDVGVRRREVHGPGFWSPSRLRYLSEGYGHREFRHLRENYQEAAIADRELNKHITDTTKEEYSTQLNILQSTISSVKHIDLNIVETYSNGSLETIAEPLSRYLCLGKELEEVTLAYGNFHPYYGTRPESCQELSEYGKTSRGLLADLSIEKPWPAIVTLHISVATDYYTFLDFLKTIASTLRTLWLDSVTLLPGDKERGTWESVLPCIPASLLKIEHLLLDDWMDFQTDGSRRKLFHSAAWECQDCYEEYRDLIVEDLLNDRTLRRSLEQEPLSNCEHQ